MRAKLILVVLFLVVLLGGCIIYMQLGMMFIINEESFFSDFHIEDNKVYLECEMSINSPRDCDIQLQGTFARDEGKLLKNPTIFAYDAENGSNSFHIVRGTNRFKVVFIGDYGGTPRKSDRLLPEIKVIELN